MPKLLTGKLEKEWVVALVDVLLNLASNTVDSQEEELTLKWENNNLVVTDVTLNFLVQKIEEKYPQLISNTKQQHDRVKVAEYKEKSKFKQYERDRLTNAINYLQLEEVDILEDTRDNKNIKYWDFQLKLKVKVIQGEKEKDIEENLNYVREKIRLPSNQLSSPQENKVADYPKIDWGQAPDLETFHGREQELAEFKKWIINKQCRLISIVGFAGIGKTKLSLKLARQVQEKFEYIIWRRLYDRLPLESLLKELIKFVSDGRETELATTTEGLTEQLLHYLQERRCLIILDEVESIEQSDYQEKYKDFFHYIGTRKHLSCLLLTSRVKLKRMEGISDAVRSLELSGLDLEAGRKIFQDIEQESNGKFQGTEEDRSRLISLYEGNPLVLETVGRHIHDMYDGNLAKFLEQDLRVLRNVKKLFNWHFKYLTTDEQTVLYWLALNREGISMDELREYLVSTKERKKYLPQTLEDLKGKIPVEKSGDRFTIHPLLMEYVTERVIEKVHEELISRQLKLFNTHPLIQASAKDYIKEDQIRLILQPIIDRLKESCGLEPRNSLKNRLPQLLKNLNREIDGYRAGNLINLMRYAGIDLSGMNFSGMTVWEADLQDVDLYGVNFTYCEFGNCSFSQIIDSPHAIALYPKQDLIAVADRINGIGLYRLEDWQLDLNLDQSEETRELAFSPDGNFIVSISGGRTVKVWHTDTGECRYTFTNGKRIIKSIAFAPDNQTVAIASKPAIFPTSERDSAKSESYTISLWNIQTDECRIIETEPWRWDGMSITFHSQKNLLFGMEDSQLSVWNTDTKELLYSHDFKAIITENSRFHVENAEAFDLHPSKEILVTGGFFGEIKLWDVKTGQRLKTFDNNNIEGLSVMHPLCFISFSGDGHTIVTVYKNGTIKLWDVKRGKCLQTWKSNDDFIYTTAFSPQDNILAIAYGSKVLKLLNVETEKWLKTRQFHSSDISKISISSDGQYLASHSPDNTIRLLNLKFERLSTWRLNHVIYGESLDDSHRKYFSPDCQTLAIFSEANVIKLFDVKTGQHQKTFKQLPSTSSKSEYPKMKFSPDGNLLGCRSLNSSEIILWDLRTKEMLRSIETKINSEIDFVSTFRILFSQNNQYLANLSNNTKFEGVSSGEDSYPILTLATIIQIWDIETGECCYNHDVTNVFDPYNFNIMAFHPNDRVLVCYDRSKNEIVLFNFQTGEFRSTLKVHEAEVRDVFFDSEANICIVTTINTTIEIWKVGTNEPIQVLEGHESDIKGVNHTPDGRILVSYDIDNNIYVWNIETGNLDRRGCLEMPYKGMNIAGATGLTDAQIDILITLGADTDGETTSRIDI